MNSRVPRHIGRNGRPCGPVAAVNHDEIVEDNTAWSFARMGTVNVRFEVGRLGQYPVPH